VDSLRATQYILRDSTQHRTLFTTGADFDAAGVGPVGQGILPLVKTPLVTVVSPASGYDSARALTNPRIDFQRRFKRPTPLSAVYQPVLPINLRRPGFPDSITLTFADTFVDTSIALFPLTAKPAKFRIVAHSDTGDIRMKFRFRDFDNDGTLSRADEFIDIVTYARTQPTTPSVTWRVAIDTLGKDLRGPILPPRLGDTWQLRTIRPFGRSDQFVFATHGPSVDPAAARATSNLGPYVVPNPYIASASFEPAPFAVSGRGDRRIEFRNIAVNATIRIYTVRGDLVSTLRQDGSPSGIVAWNVRTKDNLDAAPGLYIFHVEAPGTDAHIGKFAIIK